MTEKAPQNFANHVRFDPPFHFFVLPVTALTVIAAIVHLMQRPSWFVWLKPLCLSDQITAVIGRADHFKVRLQKRHHPFKYETMIVGNQHRRPRQGTPLFHDDQHCESKRPCPEPHLRIRSSSLHARAPPRLQQLGELTG
jgi:hypothetical protein